jgi:hypothetical protein
MEIKRAIFLSRNQTDTSTIANCHVAGVEADMLTFKDRRRAYYRCGQCIDHFRR